MTPTLGIKYHPVSPAVNTTKNRSRVNIQGFFPACKATYHGTESKVIAQPARRISKTGIESKYSSPKNCGIEKLTTKNPVNNPMGTRAIVMWCAFNIR
tara:strand:+ start:969 stop:1262 length:294 start_codon:yes stop_codon:yes gene_type:complete